jgi:hypothetical protein
VSGEMRMLVDVLFIGAAPHARHGWLHGLNTDDRRFSTAYTTSRLQYPELAFFCPSTELSGETRRRSRSTTFPPRLARLHIAPKATLEIHHRSLGCP